MKTVNKSVLIWYSPAEMFTLVTQVEQYPQFLPWCDHARLLESGAEGVVAEVGIALSGLRQTFTTRNTHVSDRRVGMALVDGPFSSLDGVWNFLPLSKPGSDSAEEVACKIEFELSYAFSSVALEAVVSPVFDRIANTFVDRFVQRAESVYGPR